MFVGLDFFFFIAITSHILS